MDNQNKLPLAVKFIIGFHLVSVFFFALGQGGAVIDYDAAARMGLQFPRESIDPAVVPINQGIGLADFIIGVPLFILAALGLHLMLAFVFLFSAWGSWYLYKNYKVYD